MNGEPLLYMFYPVLGAKYERDERNFCQKCLLYICAIAILSVVENHFWPKMLTGINQTFIMQWQVRNL